MGEAWVHCYEAGATFKLDLTFLTGCVYSLDLEFGESSVVFGKSKLKYNWHNAKNSYHS